MFGAVPPGVPPDGVPSLDLVGLVFGFVGPELRVDLGVAVEDEAMFGKRRAR